MLGHACGARRDTDPPGHYMRQVIMYNFNMERFGLAAMATAFADVCWKEAYDWATEREAFGMPLIGHQVRLHAGRLLRLVSEVLHREHQERSRHSGLSRQIFHRLFPPICPALSCCVCPRTHIFLP